MKTYGNLSNLNKYPKPGPRPGSGTVSGPGPGLGPEDQDQEQDQNQDEDQNQKTSSHLLQGTQSNGLSAGHWKATGRTVFNSV